MDLTPAQVAKVLPDLDRRVLDAAAEEWERCRGWAYEVLDECQHTHRSRTQVAKCRISRKATEIVDIAGDSPSPEFRAAWWWPSNSLTVLITANLSLGGEGDGQVVAGPGRLRFVTVWLPEDSLL